MRFALLGLPVLLASAMPGELCAQVGDAVETADAAVSPTVPFAPRDECSAQPGAVEFFTNFNHAIEQRDADALMAITAPDVLLDFGGGAGHTLLRERLNSQDYLLWDELTKIRPLGCAFTDSDEGGDLTMPWYFAQETGFEDPYATMMVMGAAVPMYEQPSATSPVVQTLSWDAVLLNNSNYEMDTPFLPVETASGAKGYVASENLRSLIDYRLGATQRDGRWMISYFVAGD